MSQGRTSVIRVLSTVWMIFTASAACAQTICRPPQNYTNNDVLLRGGYVGADGNVHFTFVIEPGADTRQEEAFREAVTLWNDLSDLTSMFLEPAASGASADIRFGLGPIDYDPKTKEEIFYCGKHDPNDSSIRYHPRNMSFVDKRPDLAVKIYVHEIGHVFGLNHPANGSLMDETPYKKSKSCELGARNAKPLLPRDAKAALRCAFTIRYSHRPPTLPGRD